MEGGLLIAAKAAKINGRKVGHIKTANSNELKAYQDILCKFNLLTFARNISSDSVEGISR
ncbi:MAG: hypothetical protein II388_04010 [Clostridia bacterium]|nr:hypothetical protein [Clostridia bacterium]